MGEEAAEVAIVGAGLAGSALAARLVGLAPSLRVLLVDPAEPGPGNAYATGVRTHFMNGPVRAMSAVPGDRDHLRRWLGEADGDALIPRAVYGAYLRALVAGAASAHPGLRSLRAEVIDVTREREGFVLRDATGGRHRARAVVLALGNPLPGSTAVPAEVRDDPRYVADPWRFDGGDVRGDVLCLGSGLTALDVLAALAERDYTGRVHVVSRHGLSPLLEDPAVRALDPVALGLDPSTPLALLRTMRRAARDVVARGGDWRAVAEAIRKTSPRIWTGWSPRERRRFLRHLQPYWTIHRYRVPPETARAVARLEAAGRVVRERGRLASLAADGDALRAVVERAGARRTLRVALVVNCTGPESDYLRIETPLVRNLLRRGLIRPDPLRLGIDATPSLQAIGAHGEPWPDLFTLGPPLRGLWYETTGVPEVREQAGALAAALAARYGSGSSEAGGASVSPPLSGTPDSTS